MALRSSYLIFCAVVFLFSCEADTKDAFPVGSTGSPSGNSGDSKPQSGVITAGEWNDLDHWGFWQDLMKNQDYSGLPSYWGLNPSHRISVIVKNASGEPVSGISIRLLDDMDQEVYTASTDNYGRGELWAGFFESDALSDVSGFKLVVNDDIIINQVKSYEKGVNEVIIDAQTDLQNQAMICFVVDATGSMGDEMEYLKVELQDVIERAESENPEVQFLTSAVFYRDTDDDYITRESDFSENINTTMDFIKAQRAGGGGDYPEAVHTALNKSLALQWKKSVREKIIFLMLDAPPHYQNQVLDDYQKSLIEAAGEGIKVIPITASGIDKQTEFLMRLSAMATNGTYVFITDDSGVGNDHLEPSVGEYQVEYLNDLMVRLIDKYLQ